MNKILIIINSYDDVSHSKHLLRLVTYLAEENIRIFIHALSKSGNVQNSYGSMKNVKKLSVREAVLLIKQNRGMTILTKELRSEYLVLCIRFLLGWSNIRHLTIRPSYGFLPESVWKNIKNILFKLSLHFVDSNIAVGQTVYEKILNNSHLEKKNQYCIPNSVSDQFIEPKPSKKFHQDILRFTYTGFLENRKNVIYSLALLQGSKCKYTYNIIGKGPEEEILRHEISRRNMANSVSLVGYKDDVKKLLDDSDIFLFFSKMEGLSLSLLEAMARGLVCFASDIPENRELITDMHDGILLPINDLSQARSKFYSILNDRSKLEQLSRNARITIINNYSDQIAHPLYKKILTKKT
jgi:glycosyltransferase involved in cell wall biosynthesis